MTLDLREAEAIRGFVDKDNGLVDRKIFSDPDLYQRERSTRRES